MPKQEQTNMAKNLESENLTSGISQGDERFDQVSIALHWLTVVLIVVQYGSLWLHEAAHHGGGLAAASLSVHRSMGVVTWTVVVMRLVWRHYFAYLPPFPSSMPKLQQLVAKANEYGLYFLLLVQPITGLARVLLRGQPFELLIWQVPALFDHNDQMRAFFVEAHGLGAKALLALIGLHAGAALFHRLILRDGVLQRMLPRLPERTKLTPMMVKSRTE
jgi:superoxide oxidase